MLSILSRKSFRSSLSYFHRRTVVFAKFPYGESSFRTIKSEGSFCVDKTAYIRTLEASGKFIKIWRPRRFGKTLFCETLAEYYDAAISTDQVFNFSSVCILSISNYV
jgi:hypothetical protein